MFVSKEGKYRILIKGKVVGEFSDSRVFGELAMLYNAKRLATIQAVTQGQVWVLDRHAYQKIVISSNLKEQDEKLRFLQKVEYLNVVDPEVLRQVSNLLNTEFFHSGEIIIRQGDKGDKFYIIRAGILKKYIFLHNLKMYHYRHGNRIQDRPGGYRQTKTRTMLWRKSVTERRYQVSIQKNTQLLAKKCSFFFTLLGRRL